MMLATQNLTKAFGGVKAVDDLTIDFEAGKITGVIGPNGAGKSTLINLLSGALLPSSGQVKLDLKPINGMPRHEISMRGIARTYQNVRLFDHLTALENLETCFYATDRGGVWKEVLLPGYAAGRKKERSDRCMAILRDLGIERYAHTEARFLPYGRQRILEIARAIVRKPSVLLLDEPAAGLNHEETADLKRRLEALRRPDLAIIVVEHDMDLIMTICDRIHVINFGALLFSGSPRQVQTDPNVLKAYLGTADEFNRIHTLAEGRRADRRLRADSNPRQRVS